MTVIMRVLAHGRYPKNEGYVDQYHYLIMVTSHLLAKSISNPVR